MHSLSQSHVGKDWKEEKMSFALLSFSKLLCAMHKALCPIAVFALISTNAIAQHCDAYIEEAEATSGVIAKFNEDGTLKSILTHGEASFLAGNSNLITSAKQTAELKAKGHFSKFLNEEISVESLAESTLEQSEQTDQNGNTTGRAEELVHNIERMRSNSSAVLEGLLKLDECVDTKAKTVMVTFGWKPEDENTEHENIEVADEKNEHEKLESSGVSIVKIEVTGYGNNQDEAIANGLRIAITQVFGEIFASSMFSANATETSVVATGEGDIEEEFHSSSAALSNYVSATSGIVDSYRIVSVEINGTEYIVHLDVNLPKYNPASSTEEKKKIVVFQPKIISNKSVSYLDKSVAKQIQMELESILNETKSLTALNREDAREQNYELLNIGRSDFDLVEAAKIGNRLGADFIIITEFSKFESRRDFLDTGTVNSTAINVIEANAWIKVIDVATTNTVVSVRVPLTSRSIKAKQSMDAFAITMAHNLATVVGETVGNGFTKLGRSILSENASKISNYGKAKDRNEMNRRELREDIKDEW